MHEPNLQNIPKDYVIENDILSLRSAFVPKSGQFVDIIIGYLC